VSSNLPVLPTAVSPAALFDLVWGFVGVFGGRVRFGGEWVHRVTRMLRGFRAAPILGALPRGVRVVDF
jgi:hypothetical protein